MIVGALQWCGDKECDCWMPVILDTEKGGEDSGLVSKEIWRGQMIEHPTPVQKVEMNRLLDSELASRQGTRIPDLTFDGK